MGYEKLIHPAGPSVVFCVCLIIFSLILPDRRIIAFYWWEEGITVLIFVTFAIIAMKCHKVGTLLASPDEVSILVKKGPYFKVRHPALLGMVFAFWGILLIIGTLSALITGIIMIFVIGGWVKLEENALIEKFEAASVE